MQERLLFIDDDETLIDIMQYYLPRHFECLCLRSARGIEQHISSFGPHIIVMDIYLKGFDGRQVCKEIRDNKKFDHIPIVLTSAALFKEEDLAPFKPTGFIEKPYTHLDQFTARVKSFLKPTQLQVHDRRRIAVPTSLN